MQRRRLTLLILLGLGLASPAPGARPAEGPAAPEEASAGGGKVFLTLDEALKLAFPDCEVSKTTTYLDEAQRKRAEKLAKGKIERGVVHAYVARKEGKLVGTAYFDAHEVRTKKEVLMFVVTPKDTIRRVELLSFAEPLEYVPNGKWYAQFLGRALDDELSLKRGIRGVSGATLTARATTEAARRALALHAVVGEAPTSP